MLETKTRTLSKGLSWASQTVVLHAIATSVLATGLEADNAGDGVGVQVEGLDAAEVDVEGGKATADEFLEAFGMDD